MHTVWVIKTGINDAVFLSILSIRLIHLVVAIFYGFFFNRIEVYVLLFGDLNSTLLFFTYVCCGINEEVCINVNLFSLICTPYSSGYVTIRTTDKCDCGRKLLTSLATLISLPSEQVQY